VVGGVGERGGGGGGGGGTKNDDQIFIRKNERKDHNGDMNVRKMVMKKHGVRKCAALNRLRLVSSCRIS